MKDSIKNIGYGAAGIGIFVLMMFAFVLLIVGGVKAFEYLNPILETVGTWTWAIMLLLLFLSIVPSYRDMTGSGIILGTSVVGAIVWFTCFYITYAFWGFFGIIVGVLLLGLGFFATGVLALLFAGEGFASLALFATIVIIFFVRMLGNWIISKHYVEREIIPANSVDIK